MLEHIQNMTTWLDNLILYLIATTHSSLPLSLPPFLPPLPSSLPSLPPSPPFLVTLPFYLHLFHFFCIDLLHHTLSNAGGISHAVMLKLLFGRDWDWTTARRPKLRGLGSLPMTRHSFRMPFTWTSYHSPQSKET